MKSMILLLAITVSSALFAASVDDFNGSWKCNLVDGQKIDTIFLQIEDGNVKFIGTDYRIYSNRDESTSKLEVDNDGKVFIADEKTPLFFIKYSNYFLAKTQDGDLRCDISSLNEISSKSPQLIQLENLVAGKWKLVGVNKTVSTEGIQEIDPKTLPQTQIVFINEAEIKRHNLVSLKLSLQEGANISGLKGSFMIRGEENQIGVQPYDNYMKNYFILYLVDLDESNENKLVLIDNYTLDGKPVVEVFTFQREE